MLWRQLQSFRRLLPPFLNSTRLSPSFQPACGGESKGAMKAVQYLMPKTLDLRESPFLFPHISSLHRPRGLSNPATLCTPSGPLFQHNSFSLAKSSENHRPLDELMDHDVVNQFGLPSPNPTGDVSEVFYPTLLHSSTFLQMLLPEDEKLETNSTYALLILNHDLPLLTLFLWSKACCRICADGGANRLYDCIPSLFPHEDPIGVRERYKPDVIKGDLDSIRPEVKEFYFSLGTTILDNSEDQDTTDLWKCVAYAVDILHDIKRGHMKLLVLGAIGGRLDHTFANLNALYLFREVRIVLLSDESMAFLLAKGYRHEISINSSVEGPYCGLLPLGGPSSCTTTTGLKWDLNKTSLQFGGLISTSNMPVGDCVTVSSDTDLVWTVSLRLLHSRLKEHVGSANLAP
ncbi:hypothetical protein GOP47_0014566 [Adiantum capillus-veneris]|uniref:thiamine diphosphokinase n=1 Tax=Adiantum capillus-veneris TaxID=13818 RepID=A0A9D4ZCA2_ADICA|nr:hypothetical protein GOP47_0014566 [Adiantum capillus-veneris]